MKPQLALVDDSTPNGKMCSKVKCNILNERSVLWAAAHFQRPWHGFITNQPSPPTKPHAAPAAHVPPAKPHAAFAPAPLWVAVRSSTRPRRCRLCAFAEAPPFRGRARRTR